MAEVGEARCNDGGTIGWSTKSVGTDPDHSGQLIDAAQGLGESGQLVEHRKRGSPMGIARAAGQENALGEAFCSRTALLHPLRGQNGLPQPVASRPS